MALTYIRISPEDYCYYGNLTAINVLAGGSNYDVINPPNLVISDNIGTGATATTTVVGVSRRD